jgi:hypothetical protein
MDLKQTKLTRTEWDSIEIPVSEQEKEILCLIMEGFKNPNVIKNKTISLFSFTKVEQTAENEYFLYVKYFEPLIARTIRKYCTEGPMSKLSEWSYTTSKTTGSSSNGGGLKKMKSVDVLRIQNLESNIDQNKKGIYEFLLIDFCHELCRYYSKDDTKYAYYLYTLIQLTKASIYAVNPAVLSYMDTVISIANESIDLVKIVERAYVFIEQNPYLLEYEDKALFAHQKELFSIFKKQYSGPRLVLYIAPTGTGKTLSPLGLSTQYRVLFVCVARHIGLALAKSAISMEKKIAFAFGAETASDIRLHWFAASDFTKDWRSGGIRKVNNSIGDKVEIMICDVQSYLIAMRYMIAFNHPEKIITYWDEPTITMDYPEHELHEVIHKNWVENQIPNMVLSCATLPKEEEILDTLADFRGKFDNAEIHSIISYDCKKSIPMVTKDGFCAMPHTMYESYDDLVECVQFCIQNKTLLRYFDLSEIVRFVFYVNENDHIPERFQMRNYFPDIASITMNSLKIYYLDLLQHIHQDNWLTIYHHMKSIQTPKFYKGFNRSKSMDSMKSTDGGGLMTRTHSVNSIPTDKSALKPTNNSNGIFLTTADAHTLTDGPTIFLTEDAKKIGQFYIQQSEIPKTMFQELLQKIDSNNKVSLQLDELERTLEALTAPDPDKKTKQKEKNDESQQTPVIKDLYRKIDSFRKQIATISLESEYVPNTKAHQTKWSGKVTSNACCPVLDEETIRDVMSLAIDTSLKLLMLLGIGVFIEGADARYLEVMKRLATQQDLYLIIASSDFVFGTNYNFCHGFIGKDMANMTQAKTIQCLGRIGRSAIQSTYTARFRDDTFIYNLFKIPTVNLEAENMSRLFSS